MASANSPEQARPPWQWKPGQSGNPSGRPAVPKEVRDLARAHTEKAVATLAQLLDNADPRVRCLAADSLLDRAWGKPAQTVTAEVTVAAVDVDALRASLAARLAALALPVELPDPPALLAAPAASQEVTARAVVVPGAIASPSVVSGEPCGPGASEAPASPFPPGSQDDPQGIGR